MVTKSGDGERKDPAGCLIISNLQGLSEAEGRLKPLPEGGVWGGVTWRVQGTKKASRHAMLFCVPAVEVFSNQLLDDLDLLWELRYWIPDPTNPSKCIVDAAK